MPLFERDQVQIHYEEAGSGFPVLLLAPGGMRSAIPFWQNAGWDPLTALSDGFRVIAMDQRNAGESRAPVHASDGWQSYTGDQLALLDHLGVDRFLAVGMCIGGPFGLGLAQQAPERLAGAVLFQPIGLDDNREAFFEMFDGWGRELLETRDDVDADALAGLRQNLFGGDFLFNVSRDFVRQCRTPLLLLCGHDLYHPESVSREIAGLAPAVEFIEHWKEEPERSAAMARVRQFLELRAA